MKYFETTRQFEARTKTRKQLKNRTDS